MDCKFGGSDMTAADIVGFLRDVRFDCSSRADDSDWRLGT